MAKSNIAFATRRRLTLATLLGASALTVPAAPALAQAEEGAAAATSADDDDSNTIIVTAQRREQALEDVPLTVNVVTAETLAATGINTVRDLANVTTGFQVGNGGSFPQPAIRGITTINAGSYENNVALFVDGLYQTTPQILNMDLPNVQNIQILKGPQGTLYGRNATGGAILIDTIDPTDVWTGQVEATYGRFDDKRVRAFIAGPLDERTGFSVAGTYRQTDGYFKKASRTTPGEFDGRFLGVKQGSLRTKLKIDLTDDFTATLAYNYAKADDPRGIVFTPIENVSTSYTVPGRNTRPRNLGEASGDAFILDFTQHEGSLRLDWDIGLGALRSITGYTRARTVTDFDFNGNYQPDIHSYSNTIDKTLQQSLDLTVDSFENLTLIVGGTYYNIKTRQPDGNTTFVGPATYAGLNYPDPATTTIALNDPAYRRLSDTFFFRNKKAYAAFVDATYQVTDQLSVNLGARYSKEKQNVSGYKINYNIGFTPGFAIGAPTSCPYSRFGEMRGGLTCFNTASVGAAPGNPSAKSSRYKKFTPRASVRYEIRPGTNVYASYSKGFRGGEWNAVLPNDNPNLYFDVDQESITAYEVGLKSAGNRLRFEVAGFYYDYKDLQVSFTSQVNGIPVVILQNAPGAEIYGVEASFDYEVFDNFNVRAGATYLHARYSDNFFFTGSGVNPALAGFNTNADPLKVFQNVTLEQDLSGQQTSRAPDFTAYAGFDYLIPNGDGGIRISANAKYTDSYVVTNPSVWGGESGASLAARRIAANNPNLAPNNNAIFDAAGAAGTPFLDRANQQRARQGSFVLINASVTWTDPTDHYFVRAWGNNLLDEKYRIHYNPLSAGTYSPIAEPLTYGATIGYKF